MKLKLQLQLLLLFFVSLSFAQVGIGTTTPNGALDVTSTTQGFLLPRVALTASNVADPVVNPAGGALANGTMVYNTATAGVSPNNVLPGYYYWNGSQWIRLNADASWVTHGNSGTDASINFIGTTDNVDFVIRTNNIERLRVKNDGNIGIGTNNPNSSAILELSAIDKAILIPRVADVSLIVSPVNGMLVYDISLGCFRGFQNGVWSGCLGSNGTIVTLDCNGASHLGVLYEGVSANAVSTILSYTGSNGGSHNGQTINSTGVTGLTAILNAGTFASGSSILVFNIFGIPSSYGVATFDVTIGGQSCSFTRNVIGGISSLLCSSSVIIGDLVEDVEATSVSVSIPYTGGQGTPYEAQSIPSTGVTGLTATLSAGNFVTGNGNVNFTISGTPNASGTASFAINIGGQSCNLDVNVVSPIISLDCSGASHSGTLVSGIAASGVSSSLSYTGGIGVAYSGQTVASTGVTGLTATLIAGNFSTGNGSLIYTITGTPSTVGTASFQINIGGQSCVLTRIVTAPSFPSGEGSFGGKTCFDIAESNDNVVGCAGLSGRISQRANFNLTSTNTQTYTFTPVGTVSNVRFIFVNTNGNVISSISGGNSGNNIVTSVEATVVYNTLLSSPNPDAPSTALALGITNANPLTADIYVIYNDGATNNGTDRQLKLTPNVKDCACCMAKINATEYKEFLCHNLGADTSLDPHVPVVGLQGAYIQWGKRGPNTTGDSRVDWQTAPHNGALGFAAAPTATNANAGAISGWSTTNAPNDAWRTAGGSKTINDPCPTGYRVPTADEWSGVSNNNTVIRTGPFSNSSTHYGSMVHFGPDSATKLLSLPATGFRNYTTGELTSRGIRGYYWSSTISALYSSAAYTLDVNGIDVRPFSNTYRTHGITIRCISE